jgi:hypothetical protein
VERREAIVPDFGTKFCIVEVEGKDDGRIVHAPWWVR